MCRSGRGEPGAHVGLDVKENCQILGMVRGVCVWYWRGRGKGNTGTGTRGLDPVGTQGVGTQS